MRIATAEHIPSIYPLGKGEEPDVRKLRRTGRGTRWNVAKKDDMLQEKVLVQAPQYVHPYSTGIHTAAREAWIRISLAGDQSVFRITNGEARAVDQRSRNWTNVVTGETTGGAYCKREAQNAGDLS